MVYDRRSKRSRIVDSAQHVLGASRRLVTNSPCGFPPCNRVMGRHDGVLRRGNWMGYRGSTWDTMDFWPLTREYDAPRAKNFAPSEGSWMAQVKNAVGVPTRRRKIKSRRFLLCSWLFLGFGVMCRDQGARMPSFRIPTCRIPACRIPPRRIPSCRRGSESTS